MKKILKIVLTVAFVAGSTSVFAQKLGRINMQELVFAMPGDRRNAEKPRSLPERVDRTSSKPSA